MDLKTSARPPRKTKGDANTNGILDAGDLILQTFSDGIDDDGNGYVDDIAGWDFAGDDNNPYDDGRAASGTQRALEAAAQTNNGVGGAGVCPGCRVLPLRISDSHVATAENFASLVSLTVRTLEGENIVSGTIFGKKMPRIIRINDFYLEAIPEGHNLLIHNLDVPGIIGRIGEALGKNKINISRMQVGQEKKEKQNVILLTTSTIVSDKILDELRGLDGVFSARRIEL